MDYAIIKSGWTNLLEVIRLSDWDSWEWDNFATVKSKEDNEIKWFDKEYEAVDFMLEHFSNEMINPKYYKHEDNTGEYYID